MPSVLVVDDLRAIHEMLEAILSPAGNVCAFCANGEAALRTYKDSRYDVVLADINMEPMNGLTLLRELKAYDPHAIVIMMTGYGSSQNARDSLYEGAFDYMEKPFRISELNATLRRAFALAKTRPKAGSAAPFGPETWPSLTNFLQGKREEYIYRVLKAVHFNRDKAAKILKIPVDQIPKEDLVS